jgi:hypothetical protein
MNILKILANQRVRIAASTRRFESGLLVSEILNSMVAMIERFRSCVSGGESMLAPAPPYLAIVVSLSPYASMLGTTGKRRWQLAGVEGR